VRLHRGSLCERGVAYCDYSVRSDYSVGTCIHTRHANLYAMASMAEVALVLEGGVEEEEEEEEGGRGGGGGGGGGKRQWQREWSCRVRLECGTLALLFLGILGHSPCG